MTKIRQPKRVDKAAPLYAVLTISEASKVWHYHKVTIRRAIDTGRLVARKSNNVWLITANSLYEAFGEPA